MNKAFLIFHIRTYWHAGSARGGGLALANMVHKDPHGLPNLPGRSVKGLVRDAMYRAEKWDHIDKGRTEAIFGFNSQIDESNTKITRHDSTPGCLAFGNAELPEALRQHLEMPVDKGEKEDLAPFFYRALHATAMEDGIAKDKSLRGYQVTVPLVLSAPVHILDDRFQTQWFDDLRLCLPLIRGLGMGRNRGLGRCSVTLEVAS